MRQGGRRWRRFRLQAFNLYGTTCHICNQPGADTIDHLIPIHLGGGEFDLNNVRPAHGAKRPGCQGNYGRTPPTRRLNTSRAW
jgi:5-methylcytosine-specific restriction endonuclease McrA